MCGQLQLSVEGEPERVSICHCFACQARTGSSYGTQATFDAEQVVASGDLTEYVRIGDAGSKITYSFCPTCGSTVFYQIDQLTGKTIVPIGGFKDPQFSAPTSSIYEARKHHWVQLPADIRHFD